jgi:hypothetical protein
MSVQDVLLRIAEIERAFAPRPVPATGASFQAALGSATAGVPGALTAAPPGTTPMGAVAPTGPLGPATGSAGQKMVALAQGELGQVEQPPGSNDSPRIAMYRQATAGSGVGPWCNYFVSWAAKQAGAPLGEQGQGFGAVAATWDWAQRTGRAVPAGQRPQPGDLIVWDGRHIGIVEQVLPDGRIQTIEGNSSDRVARRVHSADGSGATGYVRLG